MALDLEEHAASSLRTQPDSRWRWRACDERAEPDSLPTPARTRRIAGTIYSCGRTRISDSTKP